MKDKTKKERCREYLPCGAGCPGYVPQGKSLESLAARLMHLCRYCYRAKFPKRGVNPGIVIEGEKLDYDVDGDPYGWIDQFHGDMR